MLRLRARLTGSGGDQGHARAGCMCAQFQPSKRLMEAMRLAASSFSGPGQERWMAASWSEGPYPIQPSILHDRQAYPSGPTGNRRFLPPDATIRPEPEGRDMLS
jgi:hypothetical protein